MGMAKNNENAQPKEKKAKKGPIPKWRTLNQIFIYAIVSLVLIILGTHGFINLNDKKTIMIFGDQDNMNHNICFTLTYFILGVIGIICSWFDFKTYKERKKAGLFNPENNPESKPAT